MIDKTATNLGRKDEGPNIELAVELAATENIAGVREIVDGLNHPDKNIRSDCIKVLYETAYRKPELVAEYTGVFIKLLGSRNNRLVWGAMTALAAVTAINAEEVFTGIDTIKKAYETGSVITVDNCISVFAGLSKASAEYEHEVFPLIIKHLESCRPKEVGQHAERAFACVNKSNSRVFRDTLLKRRPALTDPQKKRIDKLLRLIDKDEESYLTTEQEDKGDF